MRRGSSGATIRLYADGSVGKLCRTDSGRTAAQGRWLSAHRSAALPRVMSLHELGYQMEPLVSAPIWALDHHIVLHQLVGILDQYIWSQPAEVWWSRHAFNDKISALLDTFKLDDVIRSTLLRLRDSVDWSALPTCLTHGDPTLDNVMFRPATGELVVADPVPATPAVPDVRAVDLGKMLQSAVGWERVRYGGYSSGARFGPAAVRTHAVDANEWRATVLWCAVHVLRALPYVAKAVPDITDDVRRLIGDTLGVL